MPHPDWHPVEEDGAPASWPERVGCVLLATGAHTIFIDPLAPADDPDFWAWADEWCASRSVVVLETIRFHRRDRERFLSRYRASVDPPGAVVALPVEIADEILYWLPDHRALVPGDSLVVAGGDLRLCPDSWLDYLHRRPSRAAVREALTAAVELVLVSHGDPVLSGGSAALGVALAP